jgi:hypothetical protein
MAKDFDKWTDPNNKLEDLLSASLVDYAKGLVKEVTGFDPDTEIDKALATLSRPIELWKSLPHEITSVLYDVLRQNTPLEELRVFLNRVVTASNPEKLANEITSRLREVDFFETTIGKWITAAAEEGIVSLLQKVSEQTDQLAALAQKTLELLDGGKVEETLRELQKWIEEKLGLTKILAISETSFADIDPWLKQRLSDFLGKQEIIFAQLREIQLAINRLKAKAEDFYRRGYEALTEKYRAEFHYAYQKTTTRTAMIDVTFDFAADPQSARTLLAETLNGDFTRLLSQRLPGAKLNEAVLTHEIKRRSHLEINLPYFSSTLEHINLSFADGKVVDAVGGRLWLFNLKAHDAVSNNTSMSKLTVAMSLTEEAGVRKFSKEDYHYNYVLRLTKRKARREYLEDKLETLVRQYLPSAFSSNGKESFSTYLTALDKALDDSQDNNFGNLLIGLDVSLPSQTLAAWKNVPVEDLDEKYLAMSRRVQELLRRLIPLCYIQDLDQYKQSLAIYPLLAYCSLPPINRVALSGNQLKFTHDRVHDWDWKDDQLRNKVFEQFGAPKLQDQILPQVRRELQGHPNIKAEYENTKIERILSLHAPEALANFKNLMLVESDLITGIHKAGKQFRQHLDAQNVEKAVAELTKFGATLTDSFNNKVGNTIYEGSSFRPLGSLLFVEVAKIFDESLANTIRPTAMLEILALRNDSTFILENFVKGIKPEPADLVLQQRIVQVGT